MEGQARAVPVLARFRENGRGRRPVVCGVRGVCDVRRVWEIQYGIYRVDNSPPSADGTSANGTSGTGSFRSIPRSTLVHCFKPRTAIPYSPAIPHPFRGGTTHQRARRHGAPRRHPGARRGRPRWPAGAAPPARPAPLRGNFPGPAGISWGAGNQPPAARRTPRRRSPRPRRLPPGPRQANRPRAAPQMFCETYAGHGKHSMVYTG